MPRSGFYAHVATDVDDQAHSLTGWHQLYDQLAPGRFNGSIHELWINGMQIFRESTSHVLRQSCVVDSESWWFGIPMERAESCKLGSYSVGENTVAMRPGLSQFELLTPNNFEILGLVVRRNDLERHIRALNQSSVLPRAMQDELLRVRPGQKLGLQKLVRQILEQASRTPDIVVNPASTESIRNAVLDALADVCSSHETTGRAPYRQMSHYRIVREVRQHLLQNQDESITVVDLCQQFQISRRTLQYAFQDVMGMSPNAYLRTLRLNGVRRCLRDPNSGVTSVQQAAADWGFWHLSQFARDYHELFGELPSERLKRRPASFLNTQ
ncbi:helix-turn-helix domain-containing protein [Edaphobacter sp.]|uniref:helix-turn-helix domain-containing protein n=1 Tax=Edaphobacter sp. TaxID=1934404 RepID=UPI002DB74713|nr:helix-turn-helix domain-containing protein [Edaphobacter sp.]HEU5340904.1 helix-turn-helix domain-containing protein [Edaphobacter sp.]